VGQISVAEAAERLGVGVPRIHQRIADGSLPAVRVGSQWVIDEASLPLVSESTAPGRPLSRRSAWALLAVSEADQGALSELAPAERSRARSRLRHLLAESLSDHPLSEAQVHAAASQLRSLLRNRAERRLYRAAPRDLPDLRDDNRVALSGLSHPRSGIASGHLVEGYIAAHNIDGVIDDYLLTSAVADRDANVILHVASANVPITADDVGPLLLAADLAEHRGPREEARATELLKEIVKERTGLVAGGYRARGEHRKTHP
jgi:excisionase family DNA binding protein